MKAIHVIRREYTEIVRKKSFIISTILVPLIMLAFLVVPLLSTMFNSDSHVVLSVIDESDGVGHDFASMLTDSSHSGETTFVVNVISKSDDDYEGARERLLDAVSDDLLDAVVVIPADVFETSRVEYITRDLRSFAVLEKFEDTLTRIVIKRRVADLGVRVDKVETLTTGVSLDLRQLTEAGKVRERDVISEYMVVFVFVMLLYMLLLSWGITISRSILEEKGSRVIEVLLSSVTARDLLVGKVVGVGLAGLTQLSIWTIIGGAVGSYAGTMAFEATSSVNVPPMSFVYLFMYFLLGFLLYSAIFTLIGAVCSTEQDAQQLQGVVTLPMVLPIMLIMFILQSPNGVFAAVLSMIPVFTPTIMLARIVLAEPPTWQVILSIVILAVSIYVSIAFSARVFRVGILMHGKRPNLAEMIRWYKQAG